jgi:hypothetical protein
MGKQLKNAKHLEFVRTKSCCVCGKFGVEAHHLLKPWRGSRGMAMKAGDHNAIPLCPEHHRLLHHYGSEHKFFEAVKFDKDYGSMVARRLWYISPAYKEVE